MRGTFYETERSGECSQHLPVGISSAVRQEMDAVSGSLERPFKPDVTSYACRLKNNLIRYREKYEALEQNGENS